MALIANLQLTRVKVRNYSLITDGFIPRYYEYTTTVDSEDKIDISRDPYRRPFTGAGPVGVPWSEPAVTIRLKKVSFPIVQSQNVSNEPLPILSFQTTDVNKNIQITGEIKDIRDIPFAYSGNISFNYGSETAYISSAPKRTASSVKVGIPEAIRRILNQYKN